MASYNPKDLNMSRPNISSVRNRANHGMKSAADDPDRILSQSQELHSPTNNTSLLNRVSSSVTGLFSNVSWSEWLKSPSSSNARVDRSQHQRRESGPSDILSESISSSRQTGLKGSPSNQSFTQLYPEEGSVDFNPSEEEMQGQNFSECTSEKPFIPMHPSTSSDLNSFRREFSIVSSTPALSQGGVTNRESETFMRHSMISRPSTSFQNEVAPSQEDSMDIGNFAGHHHLESLQYSSSASLNRFPTGRKRIREIVEEREESDVRSTKRGKTLQSPQKIFTKEDKEPTVEIHQLKRPRFSVSSYGSPVGLYRKQTEEEEPSFSLFYPGKVMYGGASNHQRKKNRIITRKVLPRTPVSTSQSVDDSSFDGGLSTAAKRILNCIDKISTPLSNSKRILPYTNQKQMSWDTSPFVADFHKHRPPVRTREDSNTPPVTKLLTPSKVTVNKNFATLLEPSCSSLANGSCAASKSLPSAVQVSKASTSTSGISQDRYSNPDNAQLVSRKTVCRYAPVDNETPAAHSRKTLEEEAPEPKSVISGNTEIISRTRTVKNKSLLKTSETPKTNDATMANSCFVTPNTRPFSCDPTPQKDLQYEFSSPEIVFDVCELGDVSSKGIEFAFSSPLRENEILKVDNNEVGGGNSFEKFMPPKDSWECDTCLVQNNDKRAKCIACETPKPNSKSTALTKSSTLTPSFSIPTGNLGNSFKTAKGSWSCDTCLIQNEEGAAKCIACLTEKPKQVSHNAPSLISWGDAFKPKEGAWDCGACLLNNTASASKCAACETPKPAAKSALVASKSAPVSEASSQSGFTGSWGNAFIPPKGSWECQQCLIMNDEKSSRCVACQALKPKAASESKPVQEGRSLINTSYASCLTEEPFGKVNQNSLKDEGEWVCPDCIVMNRSSEEKCVGCNRSRRPSEVNDSPLCSSIPSVTTFGSEFFKAKDEWECETCLVRNKSTAQKCISCETPKAQLNRSALLSEALTGKFQFGVKHSKEPTTEIISSTNGKGNSATTNTFSFGVKNTSVDLPKFEWSNPASVVAKSQSTNGFGSSQTFFTLPAETKETVPTSKEDSLVTPPAEAVKPKPAFQFPSSVPASTQKADSNKLAFPKLATGSTTTSEGFLNPQTSVNPMTFSFLGKDDNKAAVSAPFSFSNSKNDSDKPTCVSAPFSFSNFGKDDDKPTSVLASFNFSNFGKDDDKPTSVSTPFSFSNSGKDNDKATSVSAPFSFSHSAKDNNNPSVSAPFSFSSSAKDNNKPTISAPFSFSNSGKDNNRTAVSAAFSFSNCTQGKAATAAAPSQSSSSSTFVFGQANKKPASTGFNFGETSSKEAPKSFNFSFGNTQPILKFGQTQPASSISTKPSESGPPSFLNIEAPKTSSFNATSAGGPQRRIIKKAFRRNK